MTKQIITRFAPSPTGKLHVGNTRTALINFLYAKKHGGKFILRIDDTDLVRSTNEFKDAIVSDLKWLKLNWDDTFAQSSRMAEYEVGKEKLIKLGRLYPCFETAEELDIKRKLQLSAGKPPIYDRAALSLTDAQKAEYVNKGRKCHYRFLVKDESIEWNDMVKGSVHYEGRHISDPIVIREDGTMTYMLCSTIDDMDYNISHIIRGEDHVSNTAIQKQMFEALGGIPPEFGHLSLVKSLEDKISKRTGGFDIESLRESEGLEAMAINSFFATIGTANPVMSYIEMEGLLANFDIHSFSKSPTTYMPDELLRLNHKMVVHMNYDEVLAHLNLIGAAHISKDFWNGVRANLNTVNDVLDWWKICHEKPKTNESLDKDFLQNAAKLLPQGKIEDDSWSVWTKAISEATGLKGKNLFLPLRLALTGMEHGPEMGKLLPLIGYEEVLERLSR
jgi:glutamyl-tRNA synthetase